VRLVRFVRDPELLTAGDRIDGWEVLHLRARMDASRSCAKGSSSPATRSAPSPRTSGSTRTPGPIRSGTIWVAQRIAGSPGSPFRARRVIDDPPAGPGADRASRRAARAHRGGARRPQARTVSFSLSPSRSRRRSPLCTRRDPGASRVPRPADGRSGPTTREGFRTPPQGVTPVTGSGPVTNLPDVCQSSNAKRPIPRCAAGRQVA
jgi:hypothetical protein